MSAVATAVLEGRGLYHIYREREVETVALRGADIQLTPGRWTSLMGPSGSGKSTLVHILGGLLEPAGGSVMVGNQDITRLSSEDRARLRRDLVSIVLQRDNLHPLLDVAGNVALAMRLDGRPRGEIDARVRELLTRFGLEGQSRQRATTLSGGEAQRVAIAAAIAVRPPVLLADELTGELDPGSTEAVLDLLAETCRSENTAILTVTHNPLVAARADEHLIMRDGEVHRER